MKKDEFLKYMQDIKNVWGFIDKLNNLFKEHNMQDNQIYSHPLLDDCIKLLEKLLGLEVDSAGYSTLSWYVYENDCGEGNQRMWWNGETIPIKTFDNLWEQILREISDNK